MQIEKILGLGDYIPKEKYVCFLPFRGEFGWYLLTFVKRFYGYNHDNKIVCLKPGHECLFPTAKNFFYEWQDIADECKAGIIVMKDEENIKLKVKQTFDSDDILFLSPHDASWDEKQTLAGYTFIPQAKYDRDLVVDIVIAPRNRKIDSHRNWTQENWQHVVNRLYDLGITVGLCGAQESSFNLINVKYKSYDYLDVDADVELITKAKLIIVQESGLAYLTYMCKRPTLIIDHYFRDFGADLHRDLNVFFKEVKHVWFEPESLVKEILEYLNNKNV